MSKTIKVNLSTSSIEKAIREIEDYKEDLKFKVSIFVQKLAEIGIETIDANKYSIGSSDFSDLHPYYVHVEPNKVTLVLSGKDVAFIEFGAGVYYNTPVGTSPNPLGQKLGLTIGSYGLGKGRYNLWFYKNESGEIVSTHGTKAAMPMSKAEEEIIKRFVSVAKEVFK